MKTIKFNEKEYEVPTKWEEVTLRDQMVVSEIQDSETYIKSIALLAGYCRLPVNELKKANITEVTKLFELLSFVNTPMQEEPISTFRYKGEEWNVHDTLLNGEFQDFIAVETIMKNNGNNVYKSLPMLIAILAKKHGEHLDDYEDQLNERAEFFMELPITIANSLAVFFYSIANQHSTNMGVYSNLNEIVQSKIKECKNITKKQGGLPLRYRFLNLILRFYLKFLELNWTRFWHSSQSKK